jgi:predicted transcriptional regulator
MFVLWDRRAASVADVVAALKSKKAVTYSTVQTILRILEAKGYVSHDQQGRAFIYRPIVDKHQARRRAVRQLMARMFNGSPGLLVQSVLADEEIGDEELNLLRKLLHGAREGPS